MKSVLTNYDHPTNEWAKVHLPQPNRESQRTSHIRTPRPTPEEVRQAELLLSESPRFKAKLLYNGKDHVNELLITTRKLAEEYYNLSQDTLALAILQWGSRMALSILYQ